ncbi:MAG: hypothetical protein JKY16_04455 [Lutibacter sp.]|nr:hypothetical protein [Lutibacter sp.]
MKKGTNFSESTGKIVDKNDEFDFVEEEKEEVSTAAETVDDVEKLTTLSETKDEEMASIEDAISKVDEIKIPSQQNLLEDEIKMLFQPIQQHNYLKKLLKKIQ